MIRFFFWFLWPDPKIGERYISLDEVGNPWNRLIYKVVDHKGRWFLLDYGLGLTSAKKQWELIAFYRRI